ncbi:MAG: sugar phosphate nucleotidyltransferase [Bacteroidota bacterium]
MKAIIPVAGMGSRLRPHTHTQPKPLIPVAGKPILGHIIDNLLAAGIDELVFIIGYLRDKIQQYVVQEYAEQRHFEFVVQEPRKGLAHALWVAKDTYADCEEILIVLGDTIFGSDVQKVLRMEGAILGVHEVDDPREFGIAVIDHKENLITKVVEKPMIPTSNNALVGLYRLTDISLFVDTLGKMMEKPLPPNGEYHITDAFTEMIAQGVNFRPYRVENWFDCGRKQSLLATNQILLERIEEFESYEFEGTVIIHPVQIAPGCDISGSIIGPYVALAENVTIRGSIVSNSILGAYSSLNSIILANSVIGNDTSLRGKSTIVNIGDNTEIDFDE